MPILGSYASPTGMAVAVPTIEKVLARYPIKRLVLVADRGLLSLDNLEEIACPIGFVRMR